MGPIDPEDEKDSIDLITNCMFSTDFLQNISQTIFSDKRDIVSVGRFYDLWHAHTGRKEPTIPFNPGVITGLMYVGILFAKENWFDILPDSDAATAGSDWGLDNLRVVAAKEPNPSIKYVVRRIRNSLGHGNLRINIPTTGITLDNMLAVTTFIFRDSNIRDASDTFEAELPLDGIFRLIVKTTVDHS